MRRAAKTDTNHQEIVEGLRATGCSVLDLSAVGKGCPDILVGRNGINVLMEIKTKNGKLNEKQVGWHESWKGIVATVTDLNQAIEIMNDVLKVQHRFKEAAWNR